MRSCNDIILSTAWSMYNTEKKQYTNLTSIKANLISLMLLRRPICMTWHVACDSYFGVCNCVYVCEHVTFQILPVAINHRIEINRKATRVGTFEVCVSTHVSLRMFIMQVLASQLPSLANRNAELAVPPLLWPVNCIKIGGHVALLSGATVYSLYCAINHRALLIIWRWRSRISTEI